MASICLYFQIHQPFRLKSYDCFQIGYDHFYEDHNANKDILERVSSKSYLPANKLILQLIRKYKGAFKVAYSISGTALEQFELYQPKVLQSFQKLASTGCVEFLSETYYHSLSFNFSKEEFIRQTGLHRQKIETLFKQSPRVFRNTELIYNNELAAMVENMGYEAILCEGVDNILNRRSPNRLYHPPEMYDFKCLLKNYRLSDDIAFRFSDKGWDQYPLTARKYANWVHEASAAGDVVNLFIDYETFGEHHWEDTGIFAFLKKLPEEILRYPDLDFKTPSNIIDTYPVRGEYNVPNFTSWADSERDLSAWLGNSLQQDAMSRAYQAEKIIKDTGDETLLEKWSKLLTSDHFYYMSTKQWQDGDVHKYFNPYNTPYDAYINFMNVMTDIEYVIETRGESFRDTKEPRRMLSPSLNRDDAGTEEYAEPSLYM